MNFVCLDLEGVLIPEIWIAVAEATGIAELRLTTREVKDYDQLMTHRLAVLDRNGLRLGDLHRVIDRMQPLDGAAAFLASLRQRYQVAILSDTFYEFAMPFMRKLESPTLLCHRLVLDESQRVVGYRLRQPEPKRRAVQALQSLRYRVCAAGDSYNDVAMLAEADRGFFFCAPTNVLADYPGYAHAQDYQTLIGLIDSAMEEWPANAP